jgi:dihydrofolate reductase
VRKIILQMMITLDGYIAGPNDEMDWIDNDPVMGEAHFALAENADAALVGHTVYQGMAQFWPQAAANPNAENNEAEFGKLMNEMKKIVISTKKEELTWTNAQQLLVADDDDLVNKIKELKETARRVSALVRWCADGTDLCRVRACGRVPHRYLPSHARRWEKAVSPSRQSRAHPRYAVRLRGHDRCLSPQV